MTHKGSGRYTPMWEEFWGTLKVFGFFWLLFSVLLFIILGFDRWAFWGAIVLGFIFSVLVTFLIALVTGVKNFDFQFWKKNGSK